MRQKQSLSRQAACVLAALTALAVAAGCEGTGPGDPDDSDVTGVWKFTANLSEASTVVETVLALEQGEGRITGEQLQGRRFGNICSSFGCLTFNDPLPDAPITGTVSGDRITLNLRTGSKGELETFEGVITAADEMQGNQWWADRVEDVPPPEDGEGPVAPAAPTDLAAEIVASIPAVDLSWTDNSDDEDGFAVLIRCESEEWDVVGLTDPNVTSVRVSGFASGDVCGFIVVAFRDVNGELFTSDPSNEVTVEIP